MQQVKILSIANLYIYIYLKNEKDLDIDLDLHKNIKKINNFKMILDSLIIPLGLLPLLNIKIEGSNYNHTEMEMYTGLAEQPFI